MRISPIFPALAVVCLCASAGRLSSQTRVLPAITFTGAPAYSQSELLAFTGLNSAGSLTQQQVQDAAQRLNDTGLFAEVNFTGNDKGIVFALKPAPPNAMLPVRFANFVWWQDDELDRLLKARVALYNGAAVPIAGNMRESICTALTSMLEEKGLAGASVSSITPASSRAGGSLVFSIDSPPVLIHSLALADTSPAMQSNLAYIMQDIAGQPWDKDASFSDIASRVVIVYRDQGYLDAVIVKQAHSAPAVTANGIQLDLTASVIEGAQYHVSQLAWPGSEFLSTSDFNKQSKFKPGDPDSPTALRASLKLLSNAYGAKGYIAARVLAPPVIDRTAHQVAYTISVDPGPQYRLKSVTFLGVSDEQTRQLNSAWKLHPGDIFDSTYPMKFVSQTGAILGQGYRVAIAQKQDSGALTVDLTVTLTKSAAPRQN
jgi:outer membrane protein insertion porin family